MDYTPLFNGVITVIGCMLIGLYAESPLVGFGLFLILGALHNALEALK